MVKYHNCAYLDGSIGNLISFTSFFISGIVQYIGSQILYFYARLFCPLLLVSYIDAINTSIIQKNPNFFDQNLFLSTELFYLFQIIDPTQILKMFRESNIQERHLHASFTNKPAPTFQQLSQISKLDDSATRAKISNCDVFSIPTPTAVPVTYDTVYDPSHPDADWSGMVSLKNQHKKHTQGHASQKLGIEQCEHGIVAKVERQEWGHRRQPEGGAKNASQLVLSGVGGEDNSDRFKSEYQRFAEHEGTQRDQLVLEKRLKSIKRIPDPAQARSASSRLNVGEGGQHSQYGYGTGQYTPRSQMGITMEEDQHMGGSTTYSSPYPANVNANGHSSTGAGPSSRIAPASLFGKKSFISNIASSISAKVEPPSRAVNNSDSAFSHNRTLVTDNYKPFPGTHIPALSSSLCTVLIYL